MARIVVGIDGSATGEAALRFALDEARLRHAAVEVVHAWSLPRRGPLPLGAGPTYQKDLKDQARDLLDSVVAGIDATGIPRIEPVLTHGDAGQALVRIATGAELLVVGGRGRGGLRSPLGGSVTGHVLRDAPCPVVVVPAAATP